MFYAKFNEINGYKMINIMKTNNMFFFFLLFLMIIKIVINVMQYAEVNKYVDDYKRKRTDLHEYSSSFK